MKKIDEPQSRLARARLGRRLLPWTRRTGRPPKQKPQGSRASPRVKRRLRGPPAQGDPSRVTRAGDRGFTTSLDSARGPQVRSRRTPKGWGATAVGLFHGLAGGGRPAQPTASSPIPTTIAADARSRPRAPSPPSTRIRLSLPVRRPTARP